MYISFFVLSVLANSRSEWDPNIISNVTRPPEPIKLLTTPESIRSATSVTSGDSTNSLTFSYLFFIIMNLEHGFMFVC